MQIEPDAVVFDIPQGRIVLMEDKVQWEGTDFYTNYEIVHDITEEPIGKLIRLGWETLNRQMAETIERVERDKSVRPFQEVSRG